MKTLRQALQKRAHPEKATVLMRFFKTGKGEYGEGDVFMGVTVPQTREIVRTFLDTPLSKLIPALNSPYHEERLAALLLLVEKYKKTKSEKEKKTIVNFYLKHKYAVNNWDLVDLTADKIWGNYLIDKERKILHTYVRSQNLWERRMAVIATFAFIRKNDFKETFALIEKLLADQHDLMHKACGWMLREIGKRDEKALEGFLKKHAQRMPRTMLRYAIERFPEKKRKAYLTAGK